jgi:hypothetical protein
VLNKALSSLKEFGDEFASVEHLLLGLVEGSDNVAQLLKDGGVNQEGPDRRDQGTAQGQQGHQPEPGRDLQRAEQVREEPEPARQGEQARPRDRAR